MGHKCQPTDKQSSLDTQGYDSHNYDPCSFDPHPEAYCIKSTLDIKHITPLTKCFKIITYFLCARNINNEGSLRQRFDRCSDVAMWLQCMHSQNAYHQDNIILTLDE